MNELVRRILRQPFVEWFVPERLAAMEGVEAYRARLLVAFVYGISFIGAAFSMVYPFVGVPEALVAAIVGGTCILLGPLVMSWTGSARLGAHVAGFFLYASIVMIVVMTGGMYAPGLMWLVILPTFGLVFSGFGGGLVWFGVVAATTTVFFAAEIGGVSEFWPPISDAYRHWVELLAVVSLALVILQLWTFDRWLHVQLNEDVEEARAELEHQAYYDQLTGLPNRQLLYERLRRAIDRFERDDEGFAFLFVDLDDFKAVNDSLGHTVGDRVLQTLAKRLETSVRSQDTVARFGGDEFVVLLESVSAESSASSNSPVERLCRAFQQPVEIGGDKIHLTASIGVAGATICGDVDGGMDRQIEIVRRAADRAMYGAKDRMGTTVERVGMDDHVDSSRRIQQENRIRRGIESGEFEPHYQPIYLADGHQLMGVEVLARWNHPERGVLGPDEFLPIIERRALIFEFADQILSGVLRDVGSGELSAQLDGPFWIHLNLSSQEVADPEYLEDLVERLVNRTPEEIHWRLEITESQWVRRELDFEPFRRERVGLVIDDFGKGYSSLGRLADMPCDGIKLDRQFVRRVDAESDHRALIEIVSQLGQLLEVPVVAEGVETREELEVVQQAGVTAVQGFYFARPAGFDELIASFGG